MNGLRGISRILAIRFARLGDVTLLLPSLGRLKRSFRDASVTLMTGSQCASLGELSPFVDDVIAVDRLAMRDGSKVRAAADIFRLVHDLRRRRFDLAIDFHSFGETNFFAGASGARYRTGMRRTDRDCLPFCFNLPLADEDKEIHVAEMFQRVADAVPGVSGGSEWTPLSIRIPPALRASLAQPVALRPAVAFFTGASDFGRRWPAGHFAAVIRHVVDRWGGAAHILAGNSPEEEAVAEEIVSSVRDLPEAHSFVGLGIQEIAAVIASADFLISNDTGPMHMGSALGVPTLGIFSRSLPQHYRPLGPKDCYIRKEKVEEISVQEVVDLLEGMRSALRGESPDRRP